MSITATRSIIEIGTSKGVTLPAKELKQLGVSTGDQVKVTVEVIKKNGRDQISREYAEFVEQYGETLKNLADR